jgi:hypothetical protein
LLFIPRFSPTPKIMTWHSHPHYLGDIGPWEAKKLQSDALKAFWTCLGHFRHFYLIVKIIPPRWEWQTSQIRAKKPAHFFTPYPLRCKSTMLLFCAFSEAVAEGQGRHIWPSLPSRLYLISVWISPNDTWNINDNKWQEWPRMTWITWITWISMNYMNDNSDVIWPLTKLAMGQGGSNC